MDGLKVFHDDDDNQMVSHKVQTTNASAMTTTKNISSPFDISLISETVSQ